MRKHISVFTVTTFCILLFFCWAVWKGNILHNKYPDPQIRTYQHGETVQSGSYQITFAEWQWGEDILFREKFPDYTFTYIGENGRTEEARVGFVNLIIAKVSEGRDMLDLANIGFSSGAWGNQFDAELFYLLNPELEYMTMDLAVGEVQQVTLPLVVLESQFTAAQWKNIDSKEFFVNIQYYPEHIRFAV